MRGKLSRVIGGRMIMDVDQKKNDINRLSSSILWVDRKYKFSLSDRRAYPRYRPKNDSSSISSGDIAPPALCRVVNMSPTGAAVMSKLRPELQSKVTLGCIPGDVVRHTDFGFAMQFEKTQNPALLEDLLAPAENAIEPNDSLLLDEKSILT